jgi:hypothetical protein
VQPRGFPTRRAHHLEDFGSIWRKEEASWQRSIWVFFVWSLASFLVYSGGYYPSSSFLGAWNELEERGVHGQRRLSLFTGSDLLRLS